MRASVRPPGADGRRRGGRDQDLSRSAPKTLGRCSVLAIAAGSDGVVAGHGGRHGSLSGLVPGSLQCGDLVADLVRAAKGDHDGRRSSPLLCGLQRRGLVADVARAAGGGCRRLRRLSGFGHDGVREWQGQPSGRPDRHRTEAQGRCRSPSRPTGRSDEHSSVGSSWFPWVELPSSAAALPFGLCRPGASHTGSCGIAGHRVIDASRCSWSTDACAVRGAAAWVVRPTDGSAGAGRQTPRRVRAHGTTASAYDGSG